MPAFTPAWASCPVTAHVVLLQVFVITLLLMMVLLVSAVLALPTWPYAEKWGYYPTGACGAIVMTMAALILAGRL